MNHLYKVLPNDTAIVTRILKFLSICALLLSIIGVITFSCFILEESIQMATFGTWPAQDAQDWDLVVEGIETIESINGSLRFINRWFGWVNPLAYKSYDRFSQATDYYVKGVKAKCFANSPKSFMNKTVSFSFTIQGVDDGENCVYLTGPTLIVRCSTIPTAKNVRITGIVKKQVKHRVLIIASKVEEI